MERDVSCVAINTVVNKRNGNGWIVSVALGFLMLVHKPFSKGTHASNPGISRVLIDDLIRFLMSSCETYSCLCASCSVPVALDSSAEERGPLGKAVFTWPFKLGFHASTFFSKSPRKILHVSIVSLILFSLALYSIWGGARLTPGYAVIVMDSSWHRNRVNRSIKQNRLYRGW